MQLQPMASRTIAVIAVIYSCYSYAAILDTYIRIYVTPRFKTQGVVTIIRSVEPSATGIKMKSSNQEAVKD